MSNDTKRNLADSVTHWESLKTLLWLIYSAKNEDTAEVRIDNALERIASTMKRNSDVNSEVTTVLDEVEGKKQTYEEWANGGEYIYNYVEAVPFEAIQSLKEKYRG